MLVIAILAGCAPQKPPENTADAALAQAKVTADPQQQQLWEAAAKAGPPPGMEKLQAGDRVVATRAPPIVKDQPTQVTPQRIAESVPAAFVVLDVPQELPTFAGAARVLVVREALQTIELDVGQGKPLRLQVKVRNGALRIAAGDTVQLAVRQGDPFRRDDLFAIQAKNDDFAYSLVGGQGPVKLEIPLQRLTASQTGEAKDSAMGVTVTLDRETRVMAPGEESAFKTGGLTVKVLASVAAQGEVANLLPEPYRLEIIAWRTDDRPTDPTPQ
jgi:hypothetical protein